MTETPEGRLAIEGRLSRLEAGMAAIERIESKIDQIAAVTQQVATLEQAHRSHSSGLERAFGEIEKLRQAREATAAERAREMAEAASKLAEEVKAREVGEAGVRAAVRTAQWFTGGIGVVVVGIVGWFALKVFAISDAVLILQGKMG